MMMQSIQRGNRGLEDAKQEDDAGHLEGTEDVEDTKQENDAGYLEDKEDVEDAKQENDAGHLEDKEDVGMQSKKMMQGIQRVQRM